jgi:hypothetical protein
VHAAAPAPEGWSLALASGIGYAGDVLVADDRHYRSTSTVTVGVQPRRWLAIALAFDGRYDRHTGLPGDPGADSGWALWPRLEARLGRSLAPGWNLGVGASLLLPGGDVPSVDLGATSFEAELLGSYTPPGLPLRVSTLLGYRLDRTGALVDDAAAWSDADLLSLGASDLDAVVVGAGATWDAGPLSLVAEWSWDVLVGDGAPPPASAPMRLGLGARVPLTPTVDVELATRFGLADQHALASRPTLVAFEPDFTVSAGIVLRWPLVTAATPLAQVATRGNLHGRTQDESGRPVAGAHVRATTARDVREVVAGPDGSYVFEDLPAGTVGLDAWAEGYRATTLRTQLRGGSDTEVDFHLAREEAGGQLRGVVRKLDGAPLRATVRVLPDGPRVETGADGAFALELAPGAHVIEIEAEGHVVERRDVELEDGGVTILNVELRGVP